MKRWVTFKQPLPPDERGIDMEREIYVEILEEGGTVEEAVLEGCKAARFEPEGPLTIFVYERHKETYRRGETKS